MDSFFEKIWHQTSLRNVSQKLALELAQERGNALPCKIQAVSGQIVTVNFSVLDTTPFVLPAIEVPAFGAPWIYLPYQVGDTGVVVPLDAHIDYIAGLSSALPPIHPRVSNLGSLLYVPCGNSSFAPVDANSIQLQGPSGFVMQTQNASVSIIGNGSGITMKVGGNTWTFTSSGFTMSDGFVAETHQHNYIPGSGAETTTSGPVA